MDATDMGNDLKEILVTAEDMDRRLGEMAEQIDRDYAGRELLIVGVLRGAVMVMADLSRKFAVVAAGQPHWTRSRLRHHRDRAA